MRKVTLNIYPFRAPYLFRAHRVKSTTLCTTVVRFPTFPPTRPSVVSGRNRIFWSQEGGSYITPVRMRPVWYSSLFARNTRCTLDVHWMYTGGSGRVELQLTGDSSIVGVLPCSVPDGAGAPGAG